MHVDARLKETVLWRTITWSETGKKKTLPKKVYLGFWVTSHLPLP